MTNGYASTIDAIRADLAHDLGRMTDAQLTDALLHLQLAYGAQHVGPQLPRAEDAGTWGPLEHEVTLMGVTGTGTTEAEALRTLARRAWRMHCAMEAEAAA